MARHKVYFRADGNSQIGLGHVTRCCALAEMLNEKFDCIFIINNSSPGIKSQILKSCPAIIELSQDTDAVQEAKEISRIFNPGDIVVLDGYLFNTPYQKIIKETGCLLVCIDDIHAYHFLADVVINHAGGIQPGQYSKEYYTQLYLGPAFAMLRLAFYSGIKNKGKTISSGNDVLVLLGGADPANDTKKILAQCYDAKREKKYHVVVGAAYSHLDDLEDFLRGKKDFDVTMYRNIDAAELVGLMRKCGTAITSPSTVAYEYLFTGGILYLHKIANNQDAIYKYFIDEKLGNSFTKFIGDPGLKEEVKLQYDFVENLRKIFADLQLEAQLKIKNLSVQDGELIFNWINDPVVRNQSYNSNPISWETHIAWFEKKLNDQHCRMYLFYLDDRPVAQVRFDIEMDTATLSYLINKEDRGKRLGNVVLKKGILTLLQEYKGIKKVIGFVKKDNIPSSKSFRKTGFSEEDAQEYPDSFLYTLRL